MCQDTLHACTCTVYVSNDYIYMYRPVKIEIEGNVVFILFTGPFINLPSCI